MAIAVFFVLNFGGTCCDFQSRGKLSHAREPGRVLNSFRYNVESDPLPVDSLLRRRRGACSYLIRTTGLEMDMN